MIFSRTSIRAFPRSSLPSLFRSRAASTLAFIETSQDGKIAQSSLSALSAAEKLGNPITALFVGGSAQKGAETLKGDYSVNSLKSIIVASNEAYNNYLPENVTSLCVKLLEDPEYSHFIVASSASGKNVLPRVGALLDLQPICDVTAIVDAKTFVRPMYAGNILATVECNQSKKLISVRASSFPAASAGGTEVPITKAAEQPKSSIDVKWEGENLVKSERPDLGSASRVVAGGRGLKNKETFDNLVTPLADTLHAAIGATRAAVDSGLCDNSLQIGQTGKVVAPDLYVAVGISGAIQHLAGMKDSKTIVAINSDPEAPIFQVADFGLVGDLNEVVPELTEKLAK
ncbi:LAMI_0C01332g1_1 [Lachancea mirantina]|uniref:Probable electron transfer flavoprotein subunit alpha n=1 Tax=Lachancea mirantina TaxID=1230905 RepID=A0A1G4J0M9_9SACH|nr:LAMI_0C01332g1_1 [Lachancea mirantina]